MLKTGIYYNDHNMLEYAENHINSAARMQKISEWQHKNTEFPTVNRQLTMMDCLDDCGSFGNAILKKIALIGDNGEERKIADKIAAYISEKQERTGNRMFCRRREGYKYNNTIWADDIYMSVPFLCGYYRLTGSDKYLEEAIRQIKCYYELLFMPQTGLLSHVYNMDYGCKTRIPWGRGNGWVLFSLSELLEIMPETHPERRKMTDIFRELCGSVKKRQDASGMWHQVLDDLSSYSRTSCTAMFVYAFAKGARSSWIEREYAQNAVRGWQTLKKDGKSVRRVLVDVQGYVRGRAGRKQANSPKFRGGGLGGIQLNVRFCFSVCLDNYLI